MSGDGAHYAAEVIGDGGDALAAAVVVDVDHDGAYVGVTGQLLDVLGAQAPALLVGDGGRAQRMRRDLLGAGDAGGLGQAAQEPGDVVAVEPVAGCVGHQGRRAGPGPRWADGDVQVEELGDRGLQRNADGFAALGGDDQPGTAAFVVPVGVVGSA